MTKSLLGRVFGLLAVITPNSIQGFYLCKCACGNSTLVRRSNLLSGRTRSCGCFRKGRPRSHGMSYSVEWRTWHNMRQRCYNQKNKSYQFYGGRGIVVCERWLESFENFFEDMGFRPGAKYSIDRINNDGNYEPSNCRWATAYEQNANKQNSRRKRLFEDAKESMVNGFPFFG